MTVKQLIEKLNQFPGDLSVMDINSVYLSERNEVCIIHEDTEEEIEERKRQSEKWYEDEERHHNYPDREREETFANRW